MGPPGTPLKPEHGAPLRVIIAGRYGMKQPKWLTAIQLSDHDEDGYWEQRGWDRTAAVRVYSRIDLPTDGDSLPAGRPFGIFGIANSGDRGISRVEVSTDDGQTWKDAEIERSDSDPAITDVTWVRWRLENVWFRRRAGRPSSCAQRTDRATSRTRRHGRRCRRARPGTSGSRCWSCRADLPPPPSPRPHALLC